MMVVFYTAVSFSEYYDSYKFQGFRGEDERELHTIVCPRMVSLQILMMDIVGNDK